MTPWFDLLVSRADSRLGVPRLFPFTPPCPPHHLHLDAQSWVKADQTVQDSCSVWTPVVRDGQCSPALDPEAPQRSSKEETKDLFLRFLQTSDPAATRWRTPPSPDSPLLFSHSAVSDSWQPHGLQPTWLPCPPPSSGVCSNSCLLSR